MAIVFETEKDLENLLIEHQDILEAKLELANCSFYPQMRLGTYGIADIVAIGAERFANGLAVQVTIIELKNVALTSDHLVQVARYKAFFENHIDPKVMHLEVSAVLIGPKTFTGSENVYLFQGIPWLRTFEFTFCPHKGLLLNQVGGWRRDLDSDAAITSVLDYIEDAAGEPLPPVVIAANEAVQ